MEISTTMLTFLSATSISRTKVLHRWAQVNENPSRLMGDLTEGYCMENAAPAMTVMTTTILKKIYGLLWSLPHSATKEMRLGHLMDNRPPDICA